MTPSSPIRTPNSPPTSCSVAFKEWAGICRALTRGRQSVILRKGGIAEDSGRFEPEHRAFWLYPTRLHEPAQGLREEAPPADTPEPGLVPIQALAVVDSIEFLDDPKLLEALEPFHVWTEETVQKRFAYREPGLWVLGVRVWAWPEPRQIADREEYGGCRSWVPLTEAISTAEMAPVLDDDQHAERIEQLSRALGRSVPDRTEGAGRGG